MNKEQILNLLRQLHREAAEREEKAHFAWDIPSAEYNAGAKKAYGMAIDYVEEMS